MAEHKRSNAKPSTLISRPGTMNPSGVDKAFIARLFQPSARQQSVKPSQQHFFLYNR